jgi:cyclopropane fatty-acyl-phospholipid synthase-like methyltransferase
MKKSFEAMARANYSEACERNKEAILTVLCEAFSDCETILEIGSGTGQHAVHFARHLPGLCWQPSDKPEYLDGLRNRLTIEAPVNVAVPVELDVRMRPWPVDIFDGVFSANTLHFMSLECVEMFFRGIGRALSDRGVVCVYGPFRYNGEFTSESNARFDQTLKQGDARRGIRDFETVHEYATNEGLQLVRDVPMPANNQVLIWRR